MADPVCRHEQGLCEHSSTDTSLTYAQCPGCGGIVCSGCRRVRTVLPAVRCRHRTGVCRCPEAADPKRCRGCNNQVCAWCRSIVPAERCSHPFEQEDRCACDLPDYPPGTTPPEICYVIACSGCRQMICPECDKPRY